MLGKILANGFDTETGLYIDTSLDGSGQGNYSDYYNEGALDSFLSEPSASAVLGPEIQKLMPPPPVVNADGSLNIWQPIQGLQQAVQTGINKAAADVKNSTFNTISNIVSETGTIATNVANVATDGNGLNILGLGLTALAVVVGIKLVKAFI